MNRLYSIASALLLLMSIAGCGRSEVSMPAIFSDGMVLQQDMDIPIHGTAAPGSKVTVLWQGDRYTTRADGEGMFRVTLRKAPAGGPHTLRINDLEIRDVLVGKVFLCSGQSNMELPISRCMDVVAEHVKDYTNPDIRYIKVPLSYDFDGERDDITPASWERLDKPEDALSWGALCYFVARFLQKEDGIPVGIINSSVGGSPIEAWMKESVLDADALEELAQCRKPGAVDSLRTESGKVYYEWQVEHNNLPEPESVTWNKISLFDNSWAVDGNGQNIYGSHHFKNTICLEKEQAAGGATLHLGAMIDADSTFVNGTYVGNTTYRYPPRHYAVPEGILKEGENTIEIHLYSYHDVPGAFVKEKRYSLETPSSDIPLSDGWYHTLWKRMPERRSEIFLQYKPSGLFNAMIAPLLDYPTEGVIWYQGESNCDNAEQYGDKLMTMMASWREDMHRDRLPFYVVELAAYEQADFTDHDHGWTLVQKEQARACRNTVDAYLIPNGDLGEWYDIHPQDKMTVAERIVKAIRDHESHQAL